MVEMSVSNVGGRISPIYTGVHVWEEVEII